MDLFSGASEPEPLGLDCEKKDYSRRNDFAFDVPPSSAVLGEIHHSSGQSAPNNHPAELQTPVQDLGPTRTEYESEVDPQSISLYHVCIALQRRLARVPGYAKYLIGAEEFEETPDEDQVSILWQCFRKCHEKT